MNTTESTPSDPLSAIRPLRGLVATVNLTGQVQVETAMCLMEMRAWCIENGFKKIEWREFPAQLVEAGRDAVCTHALQNKYAWLLQIDGDATFAPDALARLLHSAFITHPDADAVGAYAQLKGSFIPTVDTGTGTWEPHFPGEGVLPCIRTGGHFLLVKRSALQRFGPPWFRTRHAMRGLDALRELDNYARIKLDGNNPFVDTDEWQRLASLAQAESGGDAGSVGEDSGFCDRLLASGGRLYVNCDVLTGHIERRVISPTDLRDRMREHDRRLRAAVGVLE